MKIIAIYRIEAAPNFVIYTGDEGVKLFEDAGGEKLRELYKNQPRIMEESIKEIHQKKK